MTDIAALLANAADTKANFDFGKPYWEGRDQYAKNDLRDAFKDGLPMNGGQPDYMSMVKTLIQKGALDQGLSVAKLALDQQNLAESQKWTGVVNGGAPTPPPNLPVSANRPGGVADPAFRRDTSTDQPAPPATPLPPDQRQDPNSNVLRMPQEQAVQAWRDSVRPAVGGAQPLQPPAQQGQPQAIPQPQSVPPPQQVAQAPQQLDFNDRYSAARRGQGDDPTLGGLIPVGRTAKQQLDLIGQALASRTLNPEYAKALLAHQDAIQKAIASDRADEATTARQELADKNKSQLQILEKSTLPTLDKSRDATVASVKDIDAIHAARTELDRSGGIFSGAWAENRLAAAKFANALGVPNADKITSTEAFKTAMGERVKAIVKAFGSGTGISEGDRKYSEQISGGKIELNETSMRRILDIAEKVDRVAIDRHNILVDRAVKSNEALKPSRDTYIVQPPGIYVKPLNENGTPKTAPQIGEIRTNDHGVKGRWNGSGYEVIR